MSTTKAKINLKEGTIELEGSETFVTKHLEVFSKEMQSFRNTSKNEEKQAPNAMTNFLDDKKRRRNKTSVPKLVAAIPLDFKANGDKPSLKDFYKSKSPSTDMERVTLFAYYLKTYLGIDKIEAGHVVSCCKEIHVKIPVDIPQTFYNVQQHHAWLKS